MTPSWNRISHGMGSGCSQSKQVVLWDRLEAGPMASAAPEADSEDEPREAPARCIPDRIDGPAGGAASVAQKLEQGRPHASNR